MATRPPLKQRLCAPPYPLLPLVVYAVIALCFILHPQSAFRHFALSDPDDWMRLDQVANFLSSHNWHDLTQPRLSPGDHTVIHWSRLVDLPLAAFAVILSPLIGLKMGLMAASLVVPPLLLGLMLAIIMKMARPFVSRADIAWASTMLLFAPTILFNFTPGRVDHHAYQLIIAGLGLLCLTRIILLPHDWRIPVLAGINFACGLWIGAEALPSLLIFSLSIAIIAAWHGRLLLRQAALFGLSLAATTTLILPLARPMDEWAMTEVTWFSAAYVIFAALLGVMFVIAWLLGRYTENRWLRLGLMVSLGFAAAMLFFSLVPEALNGPYANFDRLSAPMVLDNVGEAQPLYPSLKVNPLFPESRIQKEMLFSRTLFLPFFAFIIIVWNMLHQRGQRRTLWLVAGAYLAPFMLLTLFWQMRCITYMQLFSIVPLTWCLLSLWKQIAKDYTGRSRFWAEIAAFGILGFFPVMLMPAIATGKPIFPDMVLFAGARPVSNCNLDNAAILLRDPQGFGAKPRLIMNMMNDGPELLFRTPHSVLSAPYNADGNRDSYDFFTARSDAQAEAIAHRRHAELVLLCRNISPFYAGLSGPNRAMPTLVQGKNGQLDVISDKTNPTLAERLVRNTPPPWLKRVEILDDKDYLLYEVTTP